MLCQSKGRTAVLIALVLTFATAAQAQELASNFDQLRVLIKAGDVIHVTDSKGQDVGGRLLDLSPDTLRILAHGATREFNASDVDTVTAARHGNVANGAKIGLATGAGFGALMMFMAINGNCHGECVPAVMAAALVYGGIGAGLGAGFSAMATSQRVIFVRTGTQPTKLTIAPLIDRTHAGAMLNVRW
jgi:hypothetical protein